MTTKIKADRNRDLFYFETRAMVLNLWVITPKGVIWHFKRGNINFQNKKVTSMANVVMRFYSKSLNIFHS